MFSSTAKQQPQKKPKRPAPSRDSAVTILTSGCHFSGKLYCRGSSRIGGRIEGEIVSEGLLIVEEEALITAEVRADEVIIQGHVKGKLKANGRVELTGTCRFEGDIESANLIINEGAQFNGRSIMKIKESESQRNPRIVENEREHAEVSVLKVPEVNVPK